MNIKSISCCQLLATKFYFNGKKNTQTVLMVAPRTKKSTSLSHTVRKTDIVCNEIQYEVDIVTSNGCLSEIVNLNLFHL